MLLSYLSVFISPSKFWPLAFFGLAYPLFLVVNFLFLLLWIIKKKRIAILVVLALLLGWNYHKSYIQFAGKRQDTDVENLKVMSYNVRLFDRFDWDNNPDALNQVIHFIQQQQPEIICFQEFYINEQDSFNSEWLFDQLNATPYYHLNIKDISRNRTLVGLATFSTFPIVSQGTIGFPNSMNSTSFTDVKWREDTIRIFNIHLESIRLRKREQSFISNFDFKDEDEDLEELKEISIRLRNAFIARSKQVDILRRHIKDSPHEVIVCGDFNDTPISYTYQRLTRELRDAFMESGRGIGNSYRGRFPSYRIDYILHSKSLQARAFKTHRVAFSDHYPITSSVSRRD